MKNLIKISGLIPGLSLCSVATASNITKTNTDQSRVIAAVKQAERYIKKYGTEKAMIEFRKNNDDIFIGDYNGMFYVSPVHPELIGSNQFNYKDPSGELVVQEGDVDLM